MLNSTGPIRTICIFDPALDFSKFTMDKMLHYAKNRNFADVENYITSGSKPIIYNVVRIPRSIMYRSINSITNEGDRVKACFQYAVKSVENAISDAGTIYDFTPEGKEASIAGEISKVSEEELERFDPCDVQEIGQMAWCISFLRRNIVDGYHVPPTSLDIWSRQASQFAPANPTDAPQNNSRQDSKVPVQQSATTEATPVSGANNSVLPTDATAEVQG